MSNLEAAGQAAKEMGAEVRIIKKTSSEYAQERDPLPCPSVVVNGTIVARNDTVTYQALKAVLTSEGGA